MYLCYIDEAGCSGSLKSSTDSVQPLLVIGAVFLPAHELAACTLRLLEIKRKYFPHRSAGASHLLDDILWEIKGADIRRDIRSPIRTQKRRARSFLDDALELLESCNAKIAAKVYVKAVGAPADGTSMYSATTQYLCTIFQSYLTSQNDIGVVIADSRSKACNVNVAHSVFTQRHKSTGDPFNRIIDLPIFANSENHSRIQLADLFCSAYLFPIAAYSYCLGHISNKHVWPEHEELKKRFGNRLMQLQYRYEDLEGRMRGGVTVSDAIGKRSSAVMFR